MVLNPPLLILAEEELDLFEEDFEDSLSLVWLVGWEIAVLPCRDSSTGTAAFTAWQIKLANRSKLAQAFAAAR
jgi:hypothetical protein